MCSTLNSRLSVKPNAYDRQYAIDSIVNPVLFRDPFDKLIMFYIESVPKMNLESGKTPPQWP